MLTVECDFLQNKFKMFILSPIRSLCKLGIQNKCYIPRIKHWNIKCLTTFFHFPYKRLKIDRLTFSVKLLSTSFPHLRKRKFCIQNTAQKCIQLLQYKLSNTVKVIQEATCEFHFRFLSTKPTISLI